MSDEGIRPRRRRVRTDGKTPVDSTNEKKVKYSKKKFLLFFVCFIAVLAAIRHFCHIYVPTDDFETHHFVTDEYGEDYEEIYVGDQEIYQFNDSTEENDDKLLAKTDSISTVHDSSKANTPDSCRLDKDSANASSPSYRMAYIGNYDECFPDSNDVQLSAAQSRGIRPLANRKQIKGLVSKHKLVNVSSSPFYAVEHLTYSMPYLVPRAQHLLNTIGINFVDSLHSKGMDLYIPVVTSVLRTNRDVAKLQRGNRNATSNSCHCYGTTIDISYTRFYPLTGKYTANTEQARWDDRLKQVLAEVLRDLRDEGKCYVKYEFRQKCFHLTVR